VTHVFRSPFPDIEVPDVAVDAYVLERAPALGARAAMIDGSTGRTVDFATLDAMVGRVAGGLTARGFGPGDVLAIMAPNLPEYAITFYAVTRVGGTITTINPTYTAEEVAHQLRDSGACMLVTVSVFLDTARAAAAEVGLDAIFVLGDASDGALPFTDLVASEAASSATVNPAEHVAALPYSSGTTGLAKGVMLTHRALVANLEQVTAVEPWADHEVIIAVLPFFHIYGMQVLMNAGLHAGATVVTLPRFDLEQFLDCIQTHRVTRAYVVPPIVLALAKHPLVERYDLSSVEVLLSGAAPLGADLATEAAGRIGCEVLQGYGLTETAPVTHFTPRGHYRPGTVGMLVPNTEMRIVDPGSGKDLGPGEEGEVWVRGPQLMAGYLNNPTATAATIDDEGWLHTGDVGRVDDHEHLTITDRLKELIKYKGFQVPPAELEALLLTHPAVADAAVIGIADEEAGEVPKAFIALKPGAEATEAEIKDFVAGHVAHYKQIRALEFIDAIPKSASGKILRRLLRDRA
jgi:acyl-CoA synthetase (AMP-forming)/AMP-acid ligase II